MKNRTTLYILTSAAVVAILLAAIVGAFAGGLVLAPRVLDNAQAAAAVPAAAEGSAELSPALQDADIVAAYEQSLIDLYQLAVPSVVNIDVTKKVDGEALGDFGFRHPPVPSPDGQESPEDFFNRGQGSGFVWDKEGHIVTNHHVVVNATEIQVTFSDDTTVEAELLGGDPNADLAVIKVDLPEAELQPLVVGDSDALRVGQLAIAIGNPFGQEFTMTSGIVSAVGRTIRSGNSFFSIPEVIQTDAPINPGNSGGPLLNRQGEVIGINTQIISRSGGSSGIGFAVPINIAKRVVPTLIAGENYEYAWLGITGRTMDPELAELMELPVDTRGVLVIAVSEDGPAEKAGLRGSDQTRTIGNLDIELGGDVIIAIDSQLIAGMDDLISYLVSETRPGDEVTLDLVHEDGSQETITVTLGSRPDREFFTRPQEEE